MFCQRLLFSGVAPTATQRLLGMALASPGPHNWLKGPPQSASSSSVTSSVSLLSSSSSTSSPSSSSLSSAKSADFELVGITAPLSKDVLNRDGVSIDVLDKDLLSGDVLNRDLLSVDVLSRDMLRGRRGSCHSLSQSGPGGVEDSLWKMHALGRRAAQYRGRCQLSQTLNLHQLRGTGRGREAEGMGGKHPLLGTPCSLMIDRRTFGALPKAILDASPPSFQPYLRLIRFDKPIGTMLLLWPCAWSIGLAADPGHLPDPWTLALFSAGAFFMRGSGCIINDMWDSDYDKKVERTKLRPLASGELSHFQALVFLASQLSISLGILLQLNTYSILLGAASMVLVVLYPLAKRYTYWPQIMLGVTLNWGVLLAWSGLKGSLDVAVAPLYVACVLHTVFYDTVYSHQDKYDDMLIGVKSTALKLGDQTKPWLAGFSSLMVGGLSLTGLMSGQTWPYFLGVAGVAAHLAHQVYTVDLNNADDCAGKFRSNSNLGLFLFLCIVAGSLMKAEPGPTPTPTSTIPSSVPSAEEVEGGTESS